MEHTSRRTSLDPAGIAPPAANYAHAVLSEGVDRILHTSGVVPTRPDGSVAVTVGEQAVEVWKSIGRMLHAAGMGPDNVVSVTTYVVVDHDVASVMAARDDFLGGRLCASTLVMVPALAQPAWKMEIAIVATG